MTTGLERKSAAMHTFNQISERERCLASTMNDFYPGHACAAHTNTIAFLPLTLVLLVIWTRPNTTQLMNEQAYYMNCYPF
jgi:hypothetical protein